MENDGRTHRQNLIIDDSQYSPADPESRLFARVWGFTENLSPSVIKEKRQDRGGTTHRYSGSRNRFSLVFTLNDTQHNLVFPDRHQAL